MDSQKNNPIGQSGEIFGDEFFHTMKDDLNPMSQIKNLPDQIGQSPSPSPRSAQSVPSPFLEAAPSPSPTRATEKIQVNPQPQSKPISQSPLQGDIEDIYSTSKLDNLHRAQSGKGKSSGGLLVMLVSLGLFLALAVAGYYAWVVFFQKQPEDTKIEEIRPIENPPKEEAAVKITPVYEKYSVDTPNALSIDFENMTDSDIKTLLLEKSKEAGEIKSEKPIEFVISDKNNNPIAFPIFATKASIELSADLLKNLEENFSFYVYRDGENVRTGLSINVKDGKAALEEMSKDEKNLISALSFLFLDRDVSEKPITFTENSYSGVESRYFNLDEENTISIDYGIYDEKLIIGTSKNTFRAIIDKIVGEKID